MYSKDQLIKGSRKNASRTMIAASAKVARVTRQNIFINLMSYKAGYERLKFEKLDSEEMFNKYIKAVQKVGLKQYQPMVEIITFVFWVFF